MKFYWFDYEGYFKAGQSTQFVSEMEFPSVLLVKDSWDDMGWKTTFRLRYYINETEFQVDEQLAILQENERSTELPASPFETLPSNYYALGAGFDFYERLMQLEEPVWREILSSLRDVCFNQIPVDDAELKGFRTSLLRSSEAEKIFREPALVFPWLSTASDKRLQFSYSKLFDGADAHHQVDFDFRRDVTGLNRINVLIGRNGTGKTQLLGDFANAMSGLKQVNVGQFHPFRPSFNRVIAISYSAFDNFSRPAEDTKTLSYRYCGIWENNRLLTAAGMLENYKRALLQVIESKRLGNLRSILSELLEDTVEYESLFDIQSERLFRAFQSLSSGQSILVMVLTQVVAYIRPDSIVLYDEPELHLHPDAINGLLRAFHKLLELFDSYAIVATHSPILLQEIPSKYVRVLRRFGNTPAVHNLGIESFGENLTRITEEVFESNAFENNFRSYLKRLRAAGMATDEINGFFDNRLSLNARAFLLSIENPDDEAM